jgi:membrane protein implicated in regulation of membrane protease activity
MEWLTEIVFWHWLIVAVVLVTLEMLAPGAFLLWMGISAAIVGAILFLAPSLSLIIQVIIFAVLSVISLIMYKQYQKRNPVIIDEPALNRRGEQYVGRVFTLDAPIVNGIGKVNIDDSTWKIGGEDIVAGTRVRVTAVDGTILMVEAEG